MDGLYSLRPTAAGAQPRQRAHRDGERARRGTKLQAVFDGPLGRALSHVAHLRFAARPARLARGRHAESGDGYLQLSSLFSCGTTFVRGQISEAEGPAHATAHRGTERLEWHCGREFAGSSFSSSYAAGGAGFALAAFSRERHGALPMAQHDVLAEGSDRASFQMVASGIRELRCVAR